MDNGTVFCLKLLEAMLEKGRIRRYYRAAYRPGENAIVEWYRGIHHCESHSWKRRDLTCRSNFLVKHGTQSRTERRDSAAKVYFYLWVEAPEKYIPGNQWEGATQNRDRWRGLGETTKHTVYNAVGERGDNWNVIVKQFNYEWDTKTYSRCKVRGPCKGQVWECWT